MDSESKSHVIDLHRLYYHEQVFKVGEHEETRADGVRLAFLPAKDPLTGTRMLTIIVDGIELTLGYDYDDISGLDNFVKFKEPARAPYIIKAKYWLIPAEQQLGLTATHSGLVAGEEPQ